MGIRFNADEIFEMAQQIERNGAKFYRTAAKQSSSAGTEKIFLDLAAKEDEHLATFTEMRRRFAASERLNIDPDDMAAKYLRAMADGEVFDRNADPSEKLKGRVTPRDVLKMALDLEKESIVFYSGLIDLVPKKKEKDNVLRIIREEQEHVVTLNNELASLPA